MASERLERAQFVLRGTAGHVMSHWPINFAGAAVFMRNDSNGNSVVRVHESEDGVVWTLVLISTHTAAGLANITLIENSFAAILFVSTSPYVRVSLAADNQAGVYCSLAQFPPKAREAASDY